MISSFSQRLCFSGSDHTVLYLLHENQVWSSHCTNSWAHLEPQGAQLPVCSFLSRGFWVRVGYFCPRVQGHQHWPWWRDTVDQWSYSYASIVSVNHFGPNRWQLTDPCWLLTATPEPSWPPGSQLSLDTGPLGKYLTAKTETPQPIISSLL